jgi:hypothetical protein
MKKILIGLGVLLVLGVTGFTAALYATSGLTDSTKLFFDSVRAKNYPAAYALVSNGFKAATSQDAFVSFIEGTGLAEVKDTSWSSRTVTMGAGELEGTVTTNQGGAIPLKISLVKEEGAWRIHSINKGPSGAAESDPSVPAEAEAIRLVGETMNVFNQGVRAKDFSAFHKYIAHVWQEQATVQQLNEAFAGFTKQNIDLSSVISQKPVIDKQSIEEGGVLVINGHYPADSLNVAFNLKYLKEGTAWKSVGASVDAHSAPQAEEADTADSDEAEEAE